MIKSLFLSTILATAFMGTQVLANENDATDERNLTPAEKAQQNDNSQRTNVQGTTQGATQGTDDDFNPSDGVDSDDKNLTPARKANENQNQNETNN